MWLGPSSPRSPQCVPGPPPPPPLPPVRPYHWRGAGNARRLTIYKSVSGIYTLLRPLARLHGQPFRPEDGRFQKPEKFTGFSVGERQVQDFCKTLRFRHVQGYCAYGPCTLPIQEDKGPYKVLVLGLILSIWEFAGSTFRRPDFQITSHSYLVGLIFEGL